MIPSRQLQYQRDIALFSRLCQPLREIVIADEMAAGIRIVQTIRHFALLAEHQHVAALEFPGQACGHAYAVGQHIAAMA
ncbi:hypothetical protein D3C79_854470 [compost metagenome]